MYLTKNDYNLIKFVKNNQPVPIDVVSKRFGKDITTQIDTLRKYSFVSTKYKTINLYNEVCTEDLRIYSVTQKGLDSLNQYEHEKIQRNKNLWRTFLITSLGALITALITKYV